MPNLITIRSGNHLAVTVLTSGCDRQDKVGAMERAAQTRTITVTIANYDDNQHAANENLRLQNLWDGVEIMAALLEMK